MFFYSNDKKFFHLENCFSVRVNINIFGGRGWKISSFRRVWIFLGGGEGVSININIWVEFIYLFIYFLNGPSSLLKTSKMVENVWEDKEIITDILACFCPGFT